MRFRHARTVGVALALVACGKFADTASPSALDAGPDPVADDAAPDGAEGEGGEEPDAADARAVDAPTAPGPGEVACGSSVCRPAANEACCLASGAPPSCVNRATPPACSYTLLCDKAADCAPASCAVLAGRTEASCAPKPTSADVVLCASDVECARVGLVAAQCTTSTCASFPYKTCGGVCPQL